MDVLEKSRNRIDEIDKRMISLFQERMALVANIAKYKKENNLPVFQEAREKEVLEKNLNYIYKEDMKKYVKEFIQSVMDISKEYQVKKMEDTQK